MYKILQLAAAFGVVLILTLQIGQMPQFGDKQTLVYGIGMMLNLLIGGEAIRTLWRN